MSAVWTVLFPAAALGQTTEDLRHYAQRVYTAEQGTGHLGPTRDYMATGASLASWARALARVKPPTGYERLHATLVRNARIAASVANQLRVAPSAGIVACTGRTANASDNCVEANTVVPEGAEQRMKAAIDQYFAARNRVAARLQEAGVALPGWPGDAISLPGAI
jgi:hypothetical protein